MINGIINVYKEKGYTSFDVVAKLRGILKMKKIGHTGTLDPDAEGVLPVCLGKATKVCDLLTDKDKEYEAVMLLGTVTDTQDISGEVLEHKEVSVTEAQVIAAIESFVGDYMQIPPMYSALKVDGKKLCDLARAGLTVERKPRPVKIYSITIQEINLPTVWMRVECSKGTYIRTLCQDIGEKLGCGGCMESLRRTRVAAFGLEEALRLSTIEELVKTEAKDVLPRNWNEDLFSFVDAVDSVFLQYPKATVKQEFNKLLYNGNPLGKDMLIFYSKQGDRWREEEQDDSCYTMEQMDVEQNEHRIRIYDEEGHFIGIYQWQGRACKPIKIFVEL